MDLVFFLKQLEKGININETCFYFKDDLNKKEHYLGYLPHYEKPYWVGYCDIEDGCEFKNAAELVDTPIFDKKTLRERWDNVVICSIEGCGLDEWIKYFL